MSEGPYHDAGGLSKPHVCPDVRALERERDGYKLLASARAELLACHRLGTTPAEATWKRIEEAERMLGLA